MIFPSANTGLAKTTTHKVVVPFYIYAALSFLAATILLLLSSNGILQHYFQPSSLAIIHTMALGWGTMIILGASHQLVPVLIEGELYSARLAAFSFFSAGLGIPLLVYGFFVFDMGWPAKLGGSLIISAILAYLINIALSMSRSGRENIHAIFVFTSAIWLLVTAAVGLLLVFNFTEAFLPSDSLYYLSLHAHMGLIGWFLMLVMGGGSRLIPMFLISKYNNNRLLWWIYALLNGGLLTFVFIFLRNGARWLMLLPLAALLLSLVLFAFFVYRAFRQRIRKKLDEPMQLSLLSVLMMAIPMIFLVVLMIFLLSDELENKQLVIAYGFIIFFGWLTAIIMGMTFKTLPFIVWNKVYHRLAQKGKTPNPKDLFSPKIFLWMCLFYLSGFLVFSCGILSAQVMVLQLGAVLLILSAFLYNWNVIPLAFHQPPQT